MSDRKYGNGKARTAQGYFPRREVETYDHMGKVVDIISRYQHGKEQVPFMLGGFPNIKQLEEEAELLIRDAIAHDPRLASKAAWIRADEGEIPIPEAIMAGEDNPFLNRRKTDITGRAHGECTRIVISTDSNAVSDKNTIAVIAAAKLAQQFRPVEFWWQGAWLLTGHEPEFDEKHWKGGARKPTAYHGYAFLVPLLKGDMDWSRIQFVLSSDQRDHVSHMMRDWFIRNQPKKPVLYIGNGVAEWSFLDDTTEFIRESGIQASGWYVAHHAALWAGMPDAWSVQVDAKAALQSWEPPKAPPSPDEVEKEKAEHEAMWAKWNKDAALEGEKKYKASLARSSTYVAIPK